MSCPGIMFAFFFSYLAFTPAHGAFSDQPTQIVEPDVEKIVSPFVEEKKFSGVVYVQRDDQTLHRKAYGYAYREYKVEHEPNSVFRIGSVSKQFTAALVLHLQEQGQLNVNDRVSKHIKVPESWENISIHHLLTHTSGFDAESEIVLDPKRAAAYHSTQELLSSALTTPIDETKRGTQFHYSNVGYTVLAAIIEKVTGKAYQQFFLEVLTAKAGLHHTSPDHESLITPGMSRGYLRVGENETAACCFDLTNYLGAGDIKSTATDLAKWIDLLVSETFLTRASLNQLWSGYVEMEKGFSSLQYGYGWVIKETKGELSYLHNGSVPGFTSMVIYKPATNLKIIVLSNIQVYSESDDAGLSDRIPARIGFDIEQLY